MAYTGLGSAADILSAGLSVAADPCLPKVTSLLLRLRDLEAASTPLRQVTSGATKPSGAKPPAAPAEVGIGLCRAVKPLQAIVFVRQRPWVLPVGALAVVGGLVGIGYALGRRRRRT